MKKIQKLLQLAALDKSWSTFSNGLTIIRLLLAPCVALGLYLQCWLTTSIIFMVAAMTDLLDGYVARWFNEQTHLGTILDPMADKLLLLCSFGALAFFDVPFFHIPHWFFIMVLCREVLMMVGSLVLLMCYKHAQVGPMVWGKVTTTLQILFIMWVFICYFAGWEPKKTHCYLLFILAIFSLLSLYQYIRRAINDIRLQC